MAGKGGKREGTSGEWDEDVCASCPFEEEVEEELERSAFKSLLVSVYVLPTRWFRFVSRIDRMAFENHDDGMDLEVRKKEG